MSLVWLDVLNICVLLPVMLEEHFSKYAGDTKGRMKFKLKCEY